MEVILIKHRERYDSFEESVGVAINMDIALKYAEDLKIKYPYVYGDEVGRFYFERLDLIEEIK